MITQLKERLAAYQPETMAVDFPDAGILVPLTTASEPEVILTQRAPHLKTHRGQVAFPGGKQDPDDPSLLATALRESEEEIGLGADSVEIIGSLSQVVSRHGIRVTPYVGLVAPELSFTINPAEIDSVFRVPVGFLLEDRRLRTDHLKFMGYNLRVPCWEWQGYHIWGLSAIVLSELLNAGFGANIEVFSRQEDE